LWTNDGFPPKLALKATHKFVVQIGKYDNFLEVNIVSIPVRRQDINTAIINKVTQSVLDNGFKKVFHDTSSVAIGLINSPPFTFSIVGSMSMA
jgi:hypothetical protein